MKRQFTNNIVISNNSADIRALLKKQLEKESKLTATDSLLVLREFEELEDEV